MDVREWHDEIVFLHKVRPGAADRSYGIQVAKLAGLPARSSGGRARCWRCSRRPRAASRPRTAALDELPLFAVSRSAATAEPAGPRRSSRRSTRLKPDELSPRAALEASIASRRCARAARSRNAKLSGPRLRLVGEYRLNGSMDKAIQKSAPVFRPARAARGADGGFPRARRDAAKARGAMIERLKALVADCARCGPPPARGGRQRPPLRCGPVALPG